MSILSPTNCTIGDICTSALEECGRTGTGQTPNGADITKAWARAQLMLQEWQQKRWLVYHLVTFSTVATGQTSYTFGPGGEINTNQVSAWELTALAPLSGYAGTGYAVGDTITLSPQPSAGTPYLGPQVVQVTSAGSGGAITGLQINLSSAGSIGFAANPINGDTITLGGVVWTLVSGSPGVNQTQIQASANATIAQLASDLEASSNSTIAQCLYGVSGSLANSNLKLTVMFLNPGTEGQAFTLAASSGSATPSGPNLTGGGENATTWPGPLPNSFNQATTSGIGFNAVLGYPGWTKASPIQTSLGSQRPPKLESAFLRQIQISQPNQVDYFMDILQSHEDYDKIALKKLQSFPGAVFLDSDWPLGNLFFYPVPQASIYSINVTVMQQLQTSFLTLATALNLPWEYYSALLYNLALRLRTTFSIPTFPGDTLPGMAQNALSVLRGPNTQIARLRMPKQIARKQGIYNIFSDQNY